MSPALIPPDPDGQRYTTLGRSTRRTGPLSETFSAATPPPVDERRGLLGRIVGGRASTGDTGNTAHDEHPVSPPRVPVRRWFSKTPADERVPVGNEGGERGDAELDTARVPVHQEQTEGAPGQPHVTRVPGSQELVESRPDREPIVRRRRDCRVEGCDLPRERGRSLCAAHRKRLRRHGELTADVPVGEVGVGESVADVAQRRAADERRHRELLERLSDR